MQIISEEIRRQMAGASWIRKMFEKGIELKKQVGAENVFDFSLGNPDIPPPAKLKDAMIRLADEAVKPMGVGYCPNSGYPPFRAALAEHLARQQQVDLKPEHVVVTCGAAGALTSFFRAVLEPGDEVFIYSSAPNSALLYRCEVVAADLPYHGMFRESKGYERSMRIRLVEKYPPGRYPLSFIKAHGGSVVRSARSMPQELYDAIKKSR